jgi:hypothetical protein
MENKIKETTEKLSNGTITKDDADKILLGLFGVISSKNDIDKQAQHFINSFGGYALEVIKKTRNGSLWHPSQEELFERVEEMLQK